jgi:hypothetical protein
MSGWARQKLKKLLSVAPEAEKKSGWRASVSVGGYRPVLAGASYAILPLERDCGLPAHKLLLQT